MSFRGRDVLPLYKLVHRKVSFILRHLYSDCPLSEVPPIQSIPAVVVGSRAHLQEQAVAEVTKFSAQTTV